MILKNPYRNVDDGGLLGVCFENLTDGKVDPAVRFHQHYNKTSPNLLGLRTYAIMLEVAPRPSSPKTCTKVSDGQGHTTKEELTLTATMLLFFDTPKLFDAAIPATCVPGTCNERRIQSMGRETDHGHVCLVQPPHHRKTEQSWHGLQTRGGLLGRPGPSIVSISAGDKLKGTALTVSTM